MDILRVPVKFVAKAKFFKNSKLAKKAKDALKMSYKRSRNLLRATFLGLAIILITCGCSADVTLNISNGKIEENISVNYYFNEIDTKETAKKDLKQYYPVFYNVVITDEEDIKKDGVEYYERILTELGNGYNAKYKYKFDLLD